MHVWGDKNVDWDAIGDAASWIGGQLVTWGRVSVNTTKEKWGTVRVYCHFGWYDMHSITHPRHRFNRYPTWLQQVDRVLISRIIKPMNLFVIPYQRWLYRNTYRRAIKRWPHIRAEILDSPDYPDLLEGL